MSRKTTTAAAAACLTGVLALSACGGGGFSGGNNAPQATAKGPVKLTVMIGSSGDAETNAVKAATEAWAKKTGNTVEVIAASDLGQQLGQAFASTTPPDVFYTDASKVGTFAKAGNLYAYGDQVKDAGFLPALVKAFTYDNKFYCAPKDYSTLALEINPSPSPRRVWPHARARSVRRVREAAVWRPARRSAGEPGAGGAVQRRASSPWCRPVSPGHTARPGGTRPPWGRWVRREEELLRHCLGAQPPAAARPGAAGVAVPFPVS